MALTPIALIPQVVLGGLMVPMTTTRAPPPAHVRACRRAGASRAPSSRTACALATDDAWLIDLGAATGRRSRSSSRPASSSAPSPSSPSDNLGRRWGFTTYDQTVDPVRRARRHDAGSWCAIVCVLLKRQRSGVRARWGIAAATLALRSAPRTPRAGVRPRGRATAPCPAAGRRRRQARGGQAGAEARHLAAPRRRAPLNNPQPVYPPEAQKAGLEAQVIARLESTRRATSRRRRSSPSPPGTASTRPRSRPRRSSSSRPRTGPTARPSPRASSTATPSPRAQSPRAGARRRRRRREARRASPAWCWRRASDAPLAGAARLADAARAITRRATDEKGAFAFPDLAARQVHGAGRARPASSRSRSRRTLAAGEGTEVKYRLALAHRRARGQRCTASGRRARSPSARSTSARSSASRARTATRSRAPEPARRRPAAGLPRPAHRARLGPAGHADLHRRHAGAAHLPLRRPLLGRAHRGARRRSTSTPATSAPSTAACRAASSTSACAIAEERSTTGSRRSTSSTRA